MTNNITNKLRVFNAAQFIESLSENQPTRLYMFLARHHPWEDEAQPDPVSRLEGEIYNAQYSMIAAKRIFGNDVKHVVKRVDWRTDTTYAFYDDRDPDLYSKNFYAMNRNFDVYICLYNNNGLPSTVQPESRSSRVFETSDGYKWKYLYSISAADQLKFLTTQWMPVNIDQFVQSTSIAGQISLAIPVNLGANYTKANTSVTVTGDGEGLDIDFDVLDGKVISYRILDGGFDYKYANIALTTTDQGDGATARLIIPPTGGHGFNPINELNARYVMVNSRIEYGEGYSDFPVDITYRKIGLIRSIADDQGSEINSITANANHTLIVTTSGSFDFSAGQFLTGNTSGANAYIISSNVVSNTQVEIRYTQGFDLTSNFKSFNINEEVFTANTNSSGVVTNIANPEITLGSGEILYIDNRPPVTRSPDQAENIHIVLEF